MAVLRLILGDQLSHSISALDGIDAAQDIVLMAEVREEATYVKHHKKKIAFLFSAMRHYATELRAQGIQVSYRKYDDPDNQGSIFAEVTALCQQQSIDEIVCTHPGEYRLLADMQSWSTTLSMPVDIRADDRFIASPAEFARWAEGKKQLRMEFFYREMRRKIDCLLDLQGQPEGGKWNYDAENRKKLPKNISIPAPTAFIPDAITQDVLIMVGREFADHFGDLLPFTYAVNRTQALEVLQVFINERLANFGQYQDAMAIDQPWLFHSHISFYLNAGLLTAHEVITAVEQAYQSGQYPLNAVEGFIRQVLGWREYVRGLYWYKMPAYEHENYLGAERGLPSFFWDAKTDMACLHHCLRETKENAYAHHIQRLMVLGNFALLAGLHPAEVNEWYLLVYADAYQWVELPNVTGMILFADGGVLASKPYAASGAYINKMSNYCGSCVYSVKEKTGPNACPFNYLYWHFIHQHSDKFRRNPRMAMIYKTMDKLDQTQLAHMLQDAQAFLDELQ